MFGMFCVGSASLSLEKHDNYDLLKVRVTHLNLNLIMWGLCIKVSATPLSVINEKEKLDWVGRLTIDPLYVNFNAWQNPPHGNESRIRDTKNLSTRKELMNCNSNKAVGRAALATQCVVIAYV